MLGGLEPISQALIAYCSPNAGGEFKPPATEERHSICPRVHAMPPIPPSKGAAKGREFVIFPGRDTALLWHTLSCLMEKGRVWLVATHHQVTESLSIRWPLAPQEPQPPESGSPENQKLPHDG